MALEVEWWSRRVENRNERRWKRAWARGVRKQGEEFWFVTRDTRAERA